MSTVVNLHEKTCPSCKETKALSFYHRAAGYPKGVQTYCRACIATRDDKKRRARGASVRNKVTNGKKACTVCSEAKPVSDFYRNKNGLFGWCKACWGKKARDHELKVKYGITREYYNGLLAAQAGGCAICSNPPGKTELAVDHDHRTGVVRGLLCGNCNRGIGHLKDNVDLLMSAVDYLKRHR